MGARLQCDRGKRSLPDSVVFTYQGDGDLAGHRHRRNGPLCNTRRKYYSYLCQQRYLRHDRRPDGPGHPCRAR